MGLFVDEPTESMESVVKVSVGMEPSKQSEAYII